MKTGSNPRRRLSKKSKPSSTGRAALSTQLNRADQSLCEEVVDGMLRDDRRRRREAEAKAKTERLKMLKRIAPRQDHVAKLIRHHSKKCFYYPASGKSGKDWIRPLSLFAADCELFVLTDWEASRKTVLAELNSLHTRRDSGVQIRTTEVVELCVPKLPYGILYRQPYMPDGLRPNRQQILQKQPFAWLAQVEVVIKRQRRTIQLLYTNLEGVGVYWRYFTAQGVSPRYLCWRAAHGLGGNNWTEFHYWNQALGRAVEAGAQKPAFVGLDVTLEDSYDWPWNRPVRRLPAWGVRIYSHRPAERNKKEAL